MSFIRESSVCDVRKSDDQGIKATPGGRGQGTCRGQHEAQPLAHACCCPRQLRAARCPPREYTEQQVPCSLGPHPPPSARRYSGWDLKERAKEDTSVLAALPSCSQEWVFIYKLCGCLSHRGRKGDRPGTVCRGACHPVNSYRPLETAVCCESGRPGTLVPKDTRLYPHQRPNGVSGASNRQEVRPALRDLKPGGERRISATP